MELSVAESGFNPVQLMPASFKEKFQMAQVFARSGLLPKGLDTPEKVCIALEWGHELQLSPMVAVQNIAVINGKPTLSADIMAAIVKRSPEYGGIVWNRLDSTAAECVITRKLPGGGEDKVLSSFSMEDARKAGLDKKENWVKYPKRMLKHRCLSYALRDAFPDILAGCYSPDEMDSVPDVQERNITEESVAEVTPSEPQSAAADVPSGQTDISVMLHDVLTKYKTQLGEHYQKAYDVFCGADEEAMTAMYGRCVAYLSKKGVRL